MSINNLNNFNNLFTSIDKHIINELKQYHELDTQLKTITGLTLRQLLDIAKSYNLLIDNKYKTPVWDTAKFMNSTGLNFSEVQQFLEPTNGISESFIKLPPWHSRLWIKIKKYLKVK